MADTKISDLDPVTDVVGTDEYVLARSGTSKKITAADLLAGSTGLPESGWVEAGETWTYASADDPAFTFSITGDLTGKYSPGMRVRLTQTTDKYFIVTKVAHSGGTTTVTVYGGTDYDLANAAITLPYYSVVKAPLAFPLDPAKWTVEVADTSDRTQGSPVNTTWYNLDASHTISVPIGVWRVYYEALLFVTNTASDTSIEVYATLSTANNSEVDKSMTALVATGDAAAAGKLVVGTCHRERTLSLTAKTSYYLNAMVDTGGSSMGLLGSAGTTIIRAVCAYL